MVCRLPLIKDGQNLCCIEALSSRLSASSVLRSVHITVTTLYFLRICSLLMRLIGTGVHVHCPPGPLTVHRRRWRGGAHRPDRRRRRRRRRGGAHRPRRRRRPRCGGACCPRLRRRSRRVNPVAGFGLTLPDPPLRFLFCAASSLALALPDLLGLALRVSLVCAATSLTLAGTGPPEVNDGRCALHRGLRKGVTKTRWS